LAGHEIKGGLEYEQASAEVAKRMSGGQDAHHGRRVVLAIEGLVLDFAEAARLEGSSRTACAEIARRSSTRPA
jgi:hypothetical protein